MHVSPRLANFFVFLVETGFYHVGQASLELLASSVLPALATSQSAGFTGMIPLRENLFSFFLIIYLFIYFYCILGFGVHAKNM